LFVRTLFFEKNEIIMIMMTVFNVICILVLGWVIIFLIDWLLFGYLFFAETLCLYWDAKGHTLCISVVGLQCTFCLLVASVPVRVDLFSFFVLLFYHLAILWTEWIESVHYISAKDSLYGDSLYGNVVWKQITDGKRSWHVWVNSVIIQPILLASL